MLYTLNGEENAVHGYPSGVFRKLFRSRVLNPPKTETPRVHAGPQSFMPRLVPSVFGNTQASPRTFPHHRFAYTRSCAYADVSTNPTHVSPASLPCFSFGLRCSPRSEEAAAAPELMPHFGEEQNRRRRQGRSPRHPAGDAAISRAGNARDSGDGAVATSGAGGMSASRASACDIVVVAAGRACGGSVAMHRALRLKSARPRFVSSARTCSFVAWV